MSHFTVMVIGPSSDDELTTCLAPFDENLEVPPYFRPMTDEDISTMADHYKVEPTFEALSPHSESWDGYEMVVIEGQMGHMTQRNPEAKWDYWRIGGRFEGHLILKTGAKSGLVQPLSWEWKDVKPDDRPVSCSTSQAQVGDVDFSFMRLEAGEKAVAGWERWAAFVAEFGTPPAWDPYGEYAQTIGFEAYKTQHRANPVIQKYGKVFKDLGWFASPGDFLGFEGKDDYVLYHYNKAVPCYATLIQGEGWFSPGAMGWFGMSSDEQADRIAYDNKINTVIDALPDETWITVVDCHI